MTQTYTSYEDFYKHNFFEEHSNHWNRVLHFIGINALYFFLLVSIITMDWTYLILSLISFPIFSAIGHKLIERN